MILQQKGNVAITTATINDVNYVISNLRNFDKEEIAYLYGVTPTASYCKQVVMHSFFHSHAAYSVFEKDKCVAVGGVTFFSGLLAGCACPWLVGTTQLHGNNKVFLSITHYYQHHLAKQYPKLVNCTKGNETSLHVKWLKKIGFSTLPWHLWVQTIPTHYKQGASDVAALKTLKSITPQRSNAVVFFT